MNCALILTQKGLIKSYLFEDGKTITIKDKHLFVGFFINHIFQSPNNSSQFLLELQGSTGIILKPIEYFLMSISNTYFKPDLNDFRVENESYTMAIRPV